MKNCTNSYMKNNLHVWLRQTCNPPCASTLRSGVKYLIPPTVVNEWVTLPQALHVANYVSNNASGWQFNFCCTFLPLTKGGTNTPEVCYNFTHSWSVRHRSRNSGPANKLTETRSGSFGVGKLYQRPFFSDRSKEARKYHRRIFLVTALTGQNSQTSCSNAADSAHIMTNQVAPPFQMEIGAPKSSQLPVSLPLAPASLSPHAPTSKVQPVRGLDFLQRYKHSTCLQCHQFEVAPIHLWQTNAAIIWIGVWKLNPNNLSQAIGHRKVVPADDWKPAKMSPSSALIAFQPSNKTPGPFLCISEGLERVTACKLINLCSQSQE